VNKNLQEPTVQVSARRKLVRGAFSLPAVLAVHNGSALAASSNKFRCATNAVSSNQSLPVSSVTAADTWVRVQRYKRISNNVPFVRIADINGIAALLGIAVSIPGVTSATTVIRWSDGNLQTSDINLFQTDGNNLVALRFDSGGGGASPIRIVGIVTSAQSSGASPTGTNAITQSCWTSIAMT
jgi:hypothetical protein